MIARINTEEGRATREKMYRERRAFVTNVAALCLFAISAVALVWILRTWVLK